MMKNILKISIILGSLLTLSSCCDEVELDDYLNTPYLSLDIDPYVFPDPPAEVKRNILLEDFTGHKCGNCPRAADKIEEIMASSPYSEQVIPVAIHGDGGNFNTFNPDDEKFFYDFTTPEGIDLDRHFGVSAKGLPNGLVNRKEYESGTIIGFPKWKAAIDEVINDSPVAWVDVHGQFHVSEGNNLITIDARVKMLESYPNPINVNVIIVENNMINWQKDYDATPKDIKDYVHKHVLRYNHEIKNRNLYGTWGIELETTHSNTDEIKRITTTIDGTDWNLDNLYAIAYIYDATTKEVLQVNEAHVSK